MLTSALGVGVPYSDLCESNWKAVFESKPVDVHTLLSSLI